MELNSVTPALTRSPSYLQCFRASGANLTAFGRGAPSKSAAKPRDFKGLSRKSAYFTSPNAPLLGPPAALLRPSSGRRRVSHAFLRCFGAVAAIFTAFGRAAPSINAAKPKDFKGRSRRTLYFKSPNGPADLALLLDQVDFAIRSTLRSGRDATTTTPPTRRRRRQHNDDDATTTMTTTRRRRRRRATTQRRRGQQ